MRDENATSLYVLAAICLLLMLAPKDLQTALYLDLAAFRNGEYWRALSGHFVHLSWSHCLLNVGGLIVLQQLYGRHYAHWRWLLPAIITSASISLALLMFSQALTWYAGLSGLLMGLFIAAAVNTLKQQPVVSGGVLVLVSLYVIAQQFQGELVDHWSGEFATSTRAHLYGAGGGLLSTLPRLLFTRRSNRSS